MSEANAQKAFDFVEGKVNVKQDIDAATQKKVMSFLKGDITEQKFTDALNHIVSFINSKSGKCKKGVAGLNWISMAAAMM